MNDVEWLDSLAIHWLTTQTPPKVGRPIQRIKPKKLAQIYRFMSRGLTLRQTAKKVMISPSTLYKILSNSNHPDSEQLNEAIKRGRLNSKNPIGKYLAELSIELMETKPKLIDRKELLDLGIKFADGLKKIGIGKFK
jgi:transcriptional regulator with XRE-family HTH domain